ncbi:MAG: hypothetical protein EBQ92_01730 [Proteobacteria bacterium]|nr:hypothetical protein [Pseudomonadota bacterium]
MDFHIGFRHIDHDISALAILMALLEDSPNHEVTISKKATRDLAEYMSHCSDADKPCVVAVTEDDGMKLKLLKSHSEVSDFVDDIIED